MSDNTVTRMGRNELIEENARLTAELKQVRAELKLSATEVNPNLLAEINRLEAELKQAREMEKWPGDPKSEASRRRLRLVCVEAGTDPNDKWLSELAIETIERLESQVRTLAGRLEEVSQTRCYESRGKYRWAECPDSECVIDRAALDAVDGKEKA